MSRLIRSSIVGAAIAAVLAGSPVAAADLAVAPAGAAPVAVPATQGRAFVAAANPLAVEAGLDVLRQGGSAVDAAVAIQAMLGLVEPQSSGIAGGAFLMHYDAATGQATAWNGRETAPAGATPGMFLDADGKPLKRADAVASGRATGVPGVLAMLAQVQKLHGKLAWSRLFETTARTAQDGFVVTPRMANMIERYAATPKAPDAKAYFARPDGSPLQTGDILKNPAYAAVLRRIAAEGVSAFYAGPVAEKIVARTRAEPYGGSMTLADIAGYRPEQIGALCRPYRVYVLCAPAPPASGVGLLELMGLLERTDIATRGPSDPQAWYLFAEASRVMYADRDRYVGDPHFVTVPVQGLLETRYLDERAALVGERAGPPPQAGKPAGAKMVGADATREPAGTTHFVVVDGDGDVVSMTTTVESYFGTGRMVEGFFLNNQLTDFSFSPTEKDGAPAANAVAGGKRPRSSMTPVIIFGKDGRFVGAIGSPGGNAIPAYVAKTLVGVLDWKMPMQAAMDLPNLVARGADFNGEAHKFSPEILEGLRARGIEVKRGAGEESGLHGVMVEGGAFVGGADSRREGVVRTLETGKR
ncbi:gamma-glutamyltransferase family protein [Caulobacter mirabilis]|uniref:Gamma-glutamyltransferase n=1 Tax=Caulobacter mirabilis TaxID=69666 RepID=A0A2D2B1S5_9CAUL|nr:gamma-glutamyltransferase family protein [Caulobacter mirabilis]ATQ44193.1 gamma-glutamyltransferase [Caulobacter mirabilis]